MWVPHVPSHGVFPEFLFEIQFWIGLTTGQMVWEASEKNIGLGGTEVSLIHVSGAVENMQAGKYHY